MYLIQQHYILYVHTLLHSMRIIFSIVKATGRKLNKFRTYSMQQLSQFDAIFTDDISFISINSYKHRCLKLTYRYYMMLTEVHLAT